MPQQQKPIDGSGNGADSRESKPETSHCERPFNFGGTPPTTPERPIFAGGNTGATINIDEPEQ
ncbi:MAG: hypothetical protein HGB37_01205 [Candidatus Moranbacteria bacterium]|nr:hypothetical protein [Candidatus Moranbacteria bacterium]NTW89516.1 hypothetical protein [Candidatus Moranbacteria bacterium]